MNYNFRNKTVIITGGGKGIGKAVAESFAKCGAKVVVADINKETAEKVSEEINNSSGVAQAIRVDVSQYVEVENMVNQVLDLYGQIDVLVNNAGILGFKGMVVDHPEESWDKVFDINLKGTFFCCKAVLKHMMERKSGCIINMGSMAGSHGGRPAVGVDYAVSKAGVHCLTKRIATETANLGIRCNALAPHGIRTEMFNDISPEFMEKVVGLIKMGRLAKPQELANVVLFLASDNASFITGQTIHVDGGSVYGD